MLRAYNRLCTASCRPYGATCRPIMPHAHGGGSRAMFCTSSEAGPLPHYRHLASVGEIKEDARQLSALQHLQELHGSLVEHDAVELDWMASWGLKKAPAPPRGVSLDVLCSQSRLPTSLLSLSLSPSLFSLCFALFPVSQACTCLVMSGVGKHFSWTCSSRSVPWRRSAVFTFMTSCLMSTSGAC